MPAYEITRDGFVYLCMGFTGKQAAKWKEAYIHAFNELEREIQRPTLPEDMKAEILRLNPVWGKIQRYLGLGLNQSETAKLLDCHRSTVGTHLKRMNACGLIAQSEKHQVYLGAGEYV